jgi:hypothetical protein
VDINFELTLLLDVIQCQTTGCKATKDLALYLLLGRWHLPGNWTFVSRDMRRQCSWCIQVYHESFCLFASSYRKCVRVLDYRHINPYWKNGVRNCLHIAIAMTM